MLTNPVALVLSGGGARGAYEIGVWQALRELDVQIDMVCGTSVGAINSALIAQGSFDVAVSLWKELETHMVFDLKSDAESDLDSDAEQSPDKRDKKKFYNLDFDLSLAGVPLLELGAYAKNLVTKGGTSCHALHDLLHEHIDEAAVRESPMEYGLVTVELPALNPKHLFKDHIPKGELIDFILASASCFPAVQSCAIGESKYIDGGYKDNLPVSMALEKEFSHILAVDLEAAGVVPQAPLEEAPHLLQIRCSWDLGNFLVFDKKNAARIMRLGYLDTLRTFHFYDGSLFCFSKGNIPPELLSGAEAAGKIFELDPTLLYTKESFDKKLRDAILTHKKEMEWSSRPAAKKQKNPLRILGSLSKRIKNNIREETATLLLAEYMATHPDGISLPEKIGESPLAEKLFNLPLAEKVEEGILRTERDAAAYLLGEGLISSVL